MKKLITIFLSALFLISCKNSENKAIKAENSTITTLKKIEKVNEKLIENKNLNTEIIPKNGEYSYSVEFAESGMITKDAVTVLINNNQIKIINNGILSGKKGEIIEEGIIVKHKKSGEWIIAHNEKDALAKEIGGCSDGPLVINFKKMILFLC